MDATAGQAVASFLSLFFLVFVFPFHPLWSPFIYHVFFFVFGSFSLFLLVFCFCGNSCQNMVRTWSELNASIFHSPGIRGKVCKKKKKKVKCAVDKRAKKSRVFLTRYWHYWIKLLLGRRPLFAIWEAIKVKFRWDSIKLTYCGLKVGKLKQDNTLPTIRGCILNGFHHTLPNFLCKSDQVIQLAKAKLNRSTNGFHWLELMGSTTSSGLVKAYPRKICDTHSIRNTLVHTHTH